MEEVYTKVTDHPSLIRDNKSQALLNTDIGALNEYRNRKKLAERVDGLSNEISEIKNMLGLILTKLDSDK